MTEVDSGVFTKPVLVAGASGFVGSHITRQLVEQGRKVRVLVRKTSNIEALNGLPVEIFYGDVLDKASLATAMEGCGSVFYSVVDPRFWLTDPEPIYRNNVDGLVNAMEAALSQNIQRFIFTSTMGTLGLNDKGPVTEDIPFNWEDRAPTYILARLKAENVFLQYCREKGLPGVALCIANTYGPQDFQPTPHGNMLWEAADAQVRVCWDSAAPTVDIRDAAAAALQAEKFGKTGQRYIIANEFISYPDLYAMAARERGNQPLWVIPLPIAYIGAWIVEGLFRLFRRKDYLVSVDSVYLSNVFREMDNSKAQQDLNWQPRPLAETVRDAVKWFAENKNH